MPLSNSIMSYEDIRTYLDRALESKSGIRVRIPDAEGGKPGGAAIHFRQRCYKFVTLDREQSRQLYERDNVLYGTSPFDGLTFNIEDTNSVVIRKRESVDLEVEEIE